MHLGVKRMSQLANFLLTEEWDIALSLSILLTTCLYTRGLLAVWQRAGIGHGVTLSQASLFAAGVITLLVALASPLHPLGEMLFSAHMVQHLLLVVVAAPLLILGAPVVAFAWTLPHAWRRPLAHWWKRQSTLQQVAKGVSQPLGAGSLFGAMLWLWHAPIFYEAALHNALWHALEHSMLLGTALLFWWVAIPTARSNRQRRGLSILLLLLTAMHSGLLGALITFAPTPWYESYRYTTLILAIAPLDDQQLAGVLMWWPMGLVFGAAMLWHLAVWLNAPEDGRQPTSYSTKRPSEATVRYPAAQLVGRTEKE